MVNVYRDHKTDLEAQTAIERYINKWIIIQGPLNNIRMDDDSDDGELIVEITDKLPGADDIYLYLYFQDSKWINQLTAYNHGDVIAVLGKIAQIDKFLVLLNNCELIETNQEKTAVQSE